MSQQVSIGIQPAWKAARLSLTFPKMVVSPPVIVKFSRKSNIKEQ